MMGVCRTFITSRQSELSSGESTSNIQIGNVQDITCFVSASELLETLQQPKQNYGGTVFSVTNKAKHGDLGNELYNQKENASA
jgi:hypothetical protein